MKRTVWQRAGKITIDGVEHERQQSGWLTLSGSYSQISQSYLDVTGNPLTNPNDDNEWKRGRGGNWYSGNLINETTNGGQGTLVDNDSQKSDDWDND